MANVYQGKWADFFRELELNKPVFVKCLSKEERLVISNGMTVYGKKYKRKFKSRLIGDQVKVTRIK